MKWLLDIWDSVPASWIANCWRATGLKSPGERRSVIQAVCDEVNGEAQKFNAMISSFVPEFRRLRVGDLLNSEGTESCVLELTELELFNELICSQNLDVIVKSGRKGKRNKVRVKAGCWGCQNSLKQRQL